MKLSINIIDKQLIIFLLLAFVILLFTEPVLASASQGGGLPYESWMTNLRKSLTGPVAFTVAIAGIIVTGAGLIFGGEINQFFRAVIYLVLVMSLVVGANNIMSSFFGVGASFI